MKSAQAFASLVGIIYFNVKSLAAVNNRACATTYSAEEKKRLTCWLRITHWLYFHLERRVLLSSKQ